MFTVLPSTERGGLTGALPQVFAAFSGNVAEVSMTNRCGNRPGFRPCKPVRGPRWQGPRSAEILAL